MRNNKLDHLSAQPLQRRTVTIDWVETGELFLEINVKHLRPPHEPASARESSTHRAWVQPRLVSATLSAEINPTDERR